MLKMIVLWHGPTNLMEKGSNIHAENDYALRWACEGDHLKVAKFLVEKGVNFHVEK